MLFVGERVILFGPFQFRRIFLALLPARSGLFGTDCAITRVNALIESATIRIEVHSSVRYRTEEP